MKLTGRPANNRVGTLREIRALGDGGTAELLSTVCFACPNEVNMHEEKELCHG